MDRLWEIVSHNERQELYDILKADKLNVPEFYNFYDTLLRITDDFTISANALPYAIESHAREEYDYYSIIINDEYKHDTSTIVWKMKEELEWYFSF